MDSDNELDSRDVLYPFGNDVLARAVRNPSLVQRLLSEGHPVTENAIRAAFACGNVETLQAFLATGADFDTRSRAGRESSAGMDAEWANTDTTPRFAAEVGYRFDREDRDDWYAVQHAAHLYTNNRNARNQQASIMTSLLGRRPDVFAVYPQRLAPLTIAIFPGERETRQNSPGPEQENTGHDETSYGLRSVLHSILEDGARVDPILNHPDLDLDLERRDPQGRTLLLSMCRNSIGADARIDSVLLDIAQSRITGSWQSNPFATTGSCPSLFELLRARGADLLAVDNNGRNALHHLLESADYITYDYRPTGIRNALQYMLQHCPTLVNQKDHHGTYPVHSALQRLRRYPIRRNYEENAGLDTVVEDLLAAGADPLARDGRGNTCLHYCADDGLTEELMGDRIRCLFRHFLDSGVDVNARNHVGQSALEMLLKADNKLAEVRARECSYLAGRPGLLTAAEIDDKVFEWFKMAGVRWTELDPCGRTLLHIIARHRMNRRGPARAVILIDNGVDPEAKESNGRTALDIASASGNKRMVDVLIKKRNGLQNKERPVDSSALSNGERELSLDHHSTPTKASLS